MLQPSSLSMTMQNSVIFRMYLIRERIQEQKRALRIGGKYQGNQSNRSDAAHNKAASIVTTTNLILRKPILAKIEQKIIFNI